MGNKIIITEEERKHIQEMYYDFDEPRSIGTRGNTFRDKLNTKTDFTGKKRKKKIEPEQNDFEITPEEPKIIIKTPHDILNEKYDELMGKYKKLESSIRSIKNHLENEEDFSQHKDEIFDYYKKMGYDKETINSLWVKRLKQIEDKSEWLKFNLDKEQNELGELREKIDDIENKLKQLENGDN